MRRDRMGLALALVTLLGASACSTAQGPDRWRGYNEPVFEFNDGLDRWVLGPVARGWDWLLPEFAITGVDNFFRNMDVPRTFVNDLLQGKPVDAGHDLGRFLVNTTVGVAGLFDVASPIGLRENEEDFGQTLGVWGTPSGPYALLPVLPFRCTARDWLAYPIDFAMNPLFIVTVVADLPIYGASVVDVVNERAINDEQIEENRREAIDWYVFVRDACLQDREGEVRDDAGLTAEEEEDLYDFEE
ncbi:MAG: VacJ family lipoprotein [Myxococcota bacterium]